MIIYTLTFQNWTWLNVTKTSMRNGFSMMSRIAQYKNFYYYYYYLCFSFFQIRNLSTFLFWYFLFAALLPEKICSKSKIKGKTPKYCYTSLKSWRGCIFTPVFLCVCVCVCVSVCLCVLISCEQSSSQTDAPIWTRFSLDGCVLHWLGPYWNWWPWVKGQGHGDRKCM